MKRRQPDAKEAYQIRAGILEARRDIRTGTDEEVRLAYSVLALRESVYGDNEYTKAYSRTLSKEILLRRQRAHIEQARRIKYLLNGDMDDHG